MWLSSLSTRVIVFVGINQFFIEMFWATNIHGQIMNFLNKFFCWRWTFPCWWQSYQSLLLFRCLKSPREFFVISMLASHVSHSKKYFDKFQLLCVVVTAIESIDSLIWMQTSTSIMAREEGVVRWLLSPLGLLFCHYSLHSRHSFR